MTCICGHEEPLHTGGAFGSACAAEGHIPGSSCNCAGYTKIMRCDFCMAIPALWLYPCRTTVAVSSYLGVGFIQSDEWAACADCAALIENDDRPGIAARLFLERDPDLTPDELERAKDHVLTMHTAQFWSVRHGERQPIPETAPS